MARLKNLCIWITLRLTLIFLVYFNTMVAAGGRGPKKEAFVVDFNKFGSGNDLLEKQCSKLVELGKKILGKTGVSDASTLAELYEHLTNKKGVLPKPKQTLNQCGELATVAPLHNIWPGRGKVSYLHTAVVEFTKKLNRVDNPCEMLISESPFKIENKDGKEIKFFPELQDYNGEDDYRSSTRASFYEFFLILYNWTEEIENYKPLRNKHLRHCVEKYRPDQSKKLQLKIQRLQSRAEASETTGSSSQPNHSDEITPQIAESPSATGTTVPKSGIEEGIDSSERPNKRKRDQDGKQKMTNLANKGFDMRPRVKIAPRNLAGGQLRESPIGQGAQNSAKLPDETYSVEQTRAMPMNMDQTQGQTVPQNSQYQTYEHSYSDSCFASGTCSRTQLHGQMSELASSPYVGPPQLLPQTPISSSAMNSQNVGSINMQQGKLSQHLLGQQPLQVSKPGLGFEPAPNPNNIGVNHLGSHAEQIKLQTSTSYASPTLGPHIQSNQVTDSHSNLVASHHVDQQNMLMQKENLPTPSTEHQVGQWCNMEGQCFTSRVETSSTQISGAPTNSPVLDRNYAPIPQINSPINFSEYGKTINSQLNQQGQKVQPQQGWQQTPETNPSLPLGSGPIKDAGFQGNQQILGPNQNILSAGSPQVAEPISSPNSMNLGTIQPDGIMKQTVSTTTHSERLNGASQAQFAPVVQSRPTQLPVSLNPSINSEPTVSSDASMDSLIQKKSELPNEEQQVQPNIPGSTQETSAMMGDEKPVAFVGQLEPSTSQTSLSGPNLAQQNAGQTVSAASTPGIQLDSTVAEVDEHPNVAVIHQDFSESSTGSLGIAAESSSSTARSEVDISGSGHQASTQQINENQNTPGPAPAPAPWSTDAISPDGQLIGPQNASINNNGIPPSTLTMEHSTTGSQSNSLGLPSNEVIDSAIKTFGLDKVGSQFRVPASNQAIEQPYSDGVKSGLNINDPLVSPSPSPSSGESINLTNLKDRTSATDYISTLMLGKNIGDGSSAQCIPFEEARLREKLIAKLLDQAILELNYLTSMSPDRFSCLCQGMQV